ncbi:trace amine-associated receptor 365-like [Petromyzon marinus]|uniref:trace amine-associated receptor 365-like n=1 Tax=Petromyzon marinus TaxID=7757 RepID=UPI003F710023
MDPPSSSAAAPSSPASSNSSWAAPPPLPHCALVQGSFSCSGSALSSAQRAAWLAMMSVAMASAVLGNLLVVASVLHFRRLQTRTNAFTASLAVVDLLVGLLVMPFKMTRSAYGCWFYGMAFCAAHTCLDIALCTASILHLACIAFDRHVAVCDPLRYAQRVTARHVAAMVALSWCCGAVISVVTVSLGWNVVGVPDEVVAASCTDSCDFLLGAPYAVGSSVCSFFGPAAFVVVAYARILREARRQGRAIACEQWRHQRQQEKQQQQNEDQQQGRQEDGVGEGGRGGARGEMTGNGGVVGKRYEIGGGRAEGLGTVGKIGSVLEGGRLTTAPAGKATQAVGRAADAKSERNATKMLSIVVGIFLASWLPFFLMNVSDPLLGYSIDPRAWEAVTWLGYANSAANPVIYGIFSPNFRAAFRVIAARSAFRAGSRDVQLGF